MTTETIPNRAAELISQRDSLTLIADYQNLGERRTVEAATVRGWIMAALEARGDLGLLAVADGLCPVCWAELNHCDCMEA